MLTNLQNWDLQAIANYGAIVLSAFAFADFATILIVRHFLHRGDASGSKSA